MRSNREPSLVCPGHGHCGEQNRPRSRAPLMECCLCSEALGEAGQWTSCDIMTDLDQQRQYLASARYAQIMRKNIKIPSNYYISTDPRTLPAQVIKSVASSAWASDRPRRLVMRSASNVTVRRAHYVRLSTASVKRSSSMSCQYLSPGLPWEYRKAGIGVCLKGKLLIVWKENLICCLSPPLLVHDQLIGVRPSICKH